MQDGRAWGEREREFPIQMNKILVLFSLAVAEHEKQRRIPSAWWQNRRRMGQAQLCTAEHPAGDAQAGGGTH